MFSYLTRLTPTQKFLLTELNYYAGLYCASKSLIQGHNCLVCDLNGCDEMKKKEFINCLE